jgi:hypothetical protein
MSPLSNIRRSRCIVLALLGVVDVVDVVDTVDVVSVAGMVEKFLSWHQAPKAQISIFIGLLNNSYRNVAKIQ